MLSTRRTTFLVGLLTLASAAPAAADQQLQAVDGRFNVSTITIAQGERLTLANKDRVQHDVTSVDDFESKPLFQSALVDPKGSAIVEGTQYLTTGDYRFNCSIHPDMEGTVRVSSDGTPVPRGGGGAAALKATSQKLSAVKSGGAFVVKLTGEAKASAIVAATATISGKTVKLARSKVTIGSKGTKTVTLKISSKAKSAVKKASRLVVTFKATVLAGSGSQSAQVKRTYS